MPYLDFKGRKAVETFHFSVPHHTLQFDVDASLLGPGGGPTLEDNLIIEGDNLLALKALVPTHAARIKCVYLDPPYNTGNDSWIYNDNLTQPQFKEWIGKAVGNESEDACRHDKWCCMMYPRLQLIKELLRDDGVILISIDDNELYHLKVLLDDIFGSNNFVATFVWRRRSSTAMRSDIISTDHEYVLMFAKDSRFLNLVGLRGDISQYPHTDSNGISYASTDLTVGMSREQRPNQFYDLTNPRSGAIYPANPNRVWRFTRESMAQVIAEGLIIWPDETEGRQTRPRFKTQYDPTRQNPVSTWIESSSQQIEPSSSLDVLQSGFNAEGGRTLRTLFGKQVFDYPKPLSLIEALLAVTTTPDSDDIVLDCTAGSGTTGHAVLRLNLGDNGNRRFILTQQRFDSKTDEEDNVNICHDITRERLRLAISKERLSVGGCFTYARLSPNPMFGPYKDMNPPPSYEELASYVFYTDTSRPLNETEIDITTGFIGRHNGRSLYLLYRPNGEDDWGLDEEWLQRVGCVDPQKHLVIYCESLAIHSNDLRTWQEVNGKTVRRMLIPWELR